MHQPIKVAPGQQYGQRQQLENAQRQIPLPENAGVPAAAPPPQVGPVGMPAPGPFMRPTDRPDEPLTAGLPSGPGVGPEALGMGTTAGPDVIGAQLHALYAASPNNDVLRLLELHDRGF